MKASFNTCRGNNINKFIQLSFGLPGAVAGGIKGLIAHGREARGWVHRKCPVCVEGGK